jgi:Ni,Fe-hydrogenase I large subunit
MPSIPVQALERALAADHSGQFVAAPTWQGQVYETGALARQIAHPLVSDLWARYGNGLLTRLAARLVELAAIPGRMRVLARHDGVVFGDSPAPSAPIGMGMVEAARGRLVHRVEVAKGRVRRYQILAPTEWNFHPRGPLVQGLAGMRADGMDDLYRRVNLVVGALDPCVAYEVEVTGHA